MKRFRFSPATAGVAVVTAAALTFTTQVSAPVVATAQTSPITRMVLQPGSNENSAIVSWRTQGPADKEVLEVTGPDGTQAFPAKEKDGGAIAYVSNYATATGLKENTEYTYRVGSEEGGWSEPETFNTGSFGTDWSFITVSDAQIGVGADIKGQTEQWNKTIGNAVADAPQANMIWSLGDQVEGWGATIAQYDGYFSSPEIRSIPTNALPGNHETYPSDLAMKHYDEHFINPNQEPNLRDFYFERNNVLFLGLDTNASSDADIERHAEFLRKTIENRGAFNDWVIVGMHHAFFSQGTHYTDGDVTNLREKLAPVMSELDVDAVLSGHDHIYTRTHLMNGLEPVKAPAKRGDVLSPNDGEVLYITTTSAGGGKFYDFQGEDGKKYRDARMENIDPALPHESTAIWRQDYDEDYMIVDVTGDELTFRTYNANNPNLVDKVTLKNNDHAIEDPREEKPTTPAPTTTTEVVTSEVPTTVTSTETKEVPTTVTATIPAEKTTKTVTSMVPTTEEKTITTKVPTTVTVTTTAEPSELSDPSKPHEPSQPEEPSKPDEHCYEGSAGSSASPADSSDGSSDDSCSSSRGGMIGFLLGAISALIVAGGVAALDPNSPVRNNIQSMLDSIYRMYTRLF